MSVTGMFIRLGGGQPAEATDGHEQTGYTVTGVGVALFAVITTGVTATALGRAAWPMAAVLLTALLAGLLTGLLGRALAGAPSTARLDRPAGTPNLPAVAARIGAAALAGLIVAELAMTTVLDGTVERLLDERAAATADATPAVSTAQDELDRALAERRTLDGDIARASGDIDNALVVARCEFNPTPECPQTKITGVPGRGPEAGTANEMLDDARAALAAAQNRTVPLDQQIATARTTVDDARAAAVTTGDRGIGARWSAAHEYTTDQLGALLLRLLGWVLFVFLAALPLLLRWWRGETAQERRRAADAVRDRAERAADIAIAEKSAHIRAETAVVRAEQQLTAARLAAEADTTIDRERQRTRVIAALGGLEIGVTGRDTDLPAGNDARSGRDAALPVPLDARTTHRDSAGWELPLIGVVPLTGTATRWIGPLVPGFVTSAVEGAFQSASRPLRTAHHLLTEAEEVTFTLRRTRQVTTGDPDSGPRPDSAAPFRDSAAAPPADLTLDSDAIVSATTHLEPAPDPEPSAPEPRALPPGR